MLPTHGYPGLKKYPNFYGHYGTAWQNQQKEFPAFPGAILMTTNCIQRPMDSYSKNLFTTGPVGFPGVTHIDGRDFSAVINKALEMPGFTDDVEGKSVLVGFGQKCSTKRRRQSHRLSKSRPHQTLHPSRRMRRRQTRTQLLHRIRRESTQRHHHPHVGMRQIPLLRQRTRHNRRHPTATRHRPMQRRLLRSENRDGTRRRIPRRRKRPAALDGALMV